MKNIEKMNSINIVAPESAFMKVYVVEPIFTGFAAAVEVNHLSLQRAQDARYSLLSSQDVVDMSTGILDSLLNRRGSKMNWDNNLIAFLSNVLVYVVKTESYAQAVTCEAAEAGKHLHILINVYKETSREGYRFSSDASFTDSRNVLTKSAIKEYVQTLADEDAANQPELASMIQKAKYPDLVFSSKYYFDGIESVSKLPD